MNEEDQLVGPDDDGEGEGEGGLEWEMRQAMEDDDDDDDGQEEGERADEQRADEHDPEAADECAKMVSAQAAPGKVLLVEYNRKYYLVPDSDAIRVRDHGRYLVVDTPAKLGAMIATTATSADWPAPDDIDPGAIIVLKGKFREDDAHESFAWYVRIVVEGEETSDDSSIARHIPYTVVKELISYMLKDVGEDGFAGSSLVKQYQPQDSNRRVLVPLPKVNNWEAATKQPRSLAVKPPGHGGKTKADSAARAGGTAEDKEDGPSASTAPPAKKQAIGAVAARKPTPSNTPAAKAPVKAAAAPAAAKKPVTAISKPTAAAAAASKQTTLQPVRKATPTRPAAKARPPAPAPAPEPDPDPPPEEDDDDSDDEGAAAPAPEPVWHRPQANGGPIDLAVDLPQVRKYVRKLDCSEPCEDETLHVRRVYEGVNKPERNCIFMQKIVLPATCTNYKVTVEYTVPPKNSNGHRA